MDTIFHHPRTHEPALFSPQDTTPPVEHFPRVCVSTFSKPIIDKFASMEKARQIASLYCANGAVPVYQTDYCQTSIAFYQSPVGAPACASFFEEAVAMGTKAFVLFGSCGMLDEEKTKDKIIVPTAAVRDEGVSYHYREPSPEIQADASMTRILRETLRQCGFDYVEGKTWTTDAIYRETIPAIRQRKSEGCLAVEMECASMFAVSQYRKIPFIQFLYGADSLASDTWEPRDLSLCGLNHAEKYMALAFECALRLEKQVR